jgi:hypothetical protein
VRPNLYYTTAIIKIVLWIIVLLITYTSINVYEDPVIALSLWFLWVFILAWWASFFLFLLWQKLFHKLKSDEDAVKDSYKLSLLFWFFCIINVLLLLMSRRNKSVGLIILIVFIFIQIFLFEKKDGRPSN